MWTCVKCSQTNDDQESVCAHCGASRSAGRFNSAQPPRNSAAYAAGQAASHTPAFAPAAAQVQYVPDFSHVKAGRGLMLLGSLLACLTALAVLALAVVRRSVWPAELYVWLTDTAGMADEITVPLWGKLLYGLLTVLAALLAALPGLWTLALGKALRRLNRMEELL